MIIIVIRFYPIAPLGTTLFETLMANENALAYYMTTSIKTGQSFKVQTQEVTISTSYIDLKEPKETKIN
jgi:hypothetical protein